MWLQRCRGFVGVDAGAGISMHGGDTSLKKGHSGALVFFVVMLKGRGTGEELTQPMQLKQTGAHIRTKLAKRCWKHGTPKQRPLPPSTFFLIDSRNHAGSFWGQKTKIHNNMVWRIPLPWALEPECRSPCVYMVFGAPKIVVDPHGGKKLVCMAGSIIH